MQLYEKIYYDLYNKIVSGECEEGDLCPSEKELGEQYHVSKAPIRQAMNKLETIGLIERKRGKGTFVRQKKPNSYKMDLCGLSGNFYEARPGMHYTTLRVDIIDTPGKICAEVGEELPPKCIFIERLGKLDGTCVQLSRHYILDVTYRNQIEHDIQTWRYFLEGTLGIEFSKTTDKVSAVSASRDVASFFQEKSESSTLLLVERISKDKKRKPVEYSAFYMDTTRWKYTVEFGE